MPVSQKFALITINLCLDMKNLACDRGLKLSKKAIFANYSVAVPFGFGPSSGPSLFVFAQSTQSYCIIILGQEE